MQKHGRPRLLANTAGIRIMKHNIMGSKINQDIRKVVTIPKNTNFVKQQEK